MGWGHGRFRYTALHGKFVVHPLDGRRVPIITDSELVDMAFGTGAVKITPAHDPNDFEAGVRHRADGVEFINILDDDGTINARGGRFAGQTRFEARHLPWVVFAMLLNACLLSEKVRGWRCC